MISLDQFWAESGYEKDWTATKKFSGGLKSLRKNLVSICKALDDQRPRINFAKLETHVATYISETCPEPIILLDAKRHLVGDDNYRMDWFQLEISIVHELVHSYLDFMGLQTWQHPEDEVEFCCRLWGDNRDPKEVKEWADRILLKNDLVPA